MNVRTFVFSAMVVAVAAAGLVHAKGGGSAPIKDSAQSLINELVSRFPPLHPDGEWEGLNNGGDESPERQKDSARVLAAYDRLREMGISAFPALVANSQDRRFSFSRVYAAWRNHSVGDACQMLIESQVAPGMSYKSRDGANGTHGMCPMYFSHIEASGGLAKWWEARKNQTLRALQIEAYEWTVGEEEKLGFKDAQQRKEILSPLQNRLAELRGGATTRPTGGA